MEHGTHIGLLTFNLQGKGDNERASMGINEGRSEGDRANEQFTGKPKIQVKSCSDLSQGTSPTTVTFCTSNKMS